MMGLAWWGEEVGPDQDLGPWAETECEIFGSWERAFSGEWVRFSM